MAKKAPADEAARLLHELEVHQAELEVQNEELRDAREATGAALERYTEVFDFAPIGFATLDDTGAIREINHAGSQLLGLERSRAVGKRFAAFIAQPALAAFHALFANAKAHNVPSRCEAALATGTAPLPVRLTASVLHRKPGTIMLAFEDITDHVVKEAALARADEVAHANRRKDEFLAMLSHELRNPLSPIRTSVSILRLAPPGSDVACNAIDLIDRSAAHLTRLVDDLLDVTRITHGKIELRREPVELGALVRRVFGDHQAGLAARRLRVDIELPAGELWIHGDLPRLVQVLSNVLGNAEKFTPPGGQIVARVDRAGGQGVIRIRDTGVGIAPEVVAELFEPFAQAPQAFQRDLGGLGLGLAMVKSLVELHGGRVELRSDGVGRGTEVTIALPLGAPPVPAPAVEARVARTCRILIIEDTPETAQSLADALALHGHVVEAALDGRRGLDIASVFKPEVVLCDLGLPDLDGYAVARQFRSDPALAGAYLVALSGYARPDDVARALAAGFARHLAKPASLKQIESVIAASQEPRSADTAAPDRPA